MNTTPLLRAVASAAFLLTLGFGVSSCEEVVDIKPLNSLDADAGFQSPEDVQAGLIGAYDALQSVNYWGLRYQLFAEMGADNVRHRGTFPSFAQIFNNQILFDNVELTNIYNTIYAGINRTNYVIQQAEKFSSTSTFNKQQIIAEARLLRAFHYMNLLGYWGGKPEGYGFPDGLGVPVRLTPTITPADATPIGRSSEQEVLSIINADIEFAIVNLPATRRGVFVGQPAANALKARLALRNRDYATAAAAAATVPVLTLPVDYESMYTAKNSSESIWEMNFDPTDANSLAFFYFPAANGGRTEVAFTTSLQQAHEAGDRRLTVNAAASPAGTTRKYTRPAGDDNVILIRYAEVLLTRAEALARIGGAANLTTAVGLLNQVRTRAGLAARVVTTQDALIADILRERRVELAHEGFRWFDLRRTGTALATVPSLAASNQAFRLLWPIPQREILNSNGLIQQNPGY
ncbi:RagB/SusD family nutrient uptake outer membrane protein [Hymenobacter weizhouensis]|uniref:RagB/SusD family nutrient uptake outer membrane protein n=1 Tax=Hymenobacter sp. YIM 151500-1 TaxID=2987689 RepID=UPI0022277DC5|nr:RagB/SusD family nutrient uptake outer membrane protein [Hymenobacter sp. YIM 151500-1]UYZ63263.1 RagB/SusD family nutrient uptake outer membrane protein [Hymenobacter sp. YIM 151500-1]